MSSERKVAGLMPAAGRASRFGADKRCARLPGDRTQLEASLENAAAAFDDLLPVLRDGDTVDDLRLPHRDGRPGHPVLFGPAFWPALCELDLDKSARSLIRRDTVHYRPVPVEYSGILLDVGHPTDLDGRPTHAALSTDQPARS